MLSEDIGGIFPRIVVLFVITAWPALAQSGLPEDSIINTESHAKSSELKSRARERGQRSIPVAQLKQSLLIDGVLGELTGQSKSAVTSFRQREPQTNAAASEETEVWLAYDKHRLYVAWRLYDREPTKIRAIAGRRDAKLEAGSDKMPNADQVILYLDPYHDHRTGMVFIVSAAGVLADGKLYNESDIDWNWDGVWQGAAKIDSLGWTAEMAIPWSTLGGNTTTPMIWGIHLRRYSSRKGETSEHSVIPLSDTRLAAHFEHLELTDGLEQKANVQLVPYVGFKAQPRFRENSTIPREHWNGRGGMDLRVSLKNSIVFDGTILPDFGQVEVDPTVVNLDPYEIFFPEKRPFFYQHQELFTTPWTLLHTRRIGAPPTAPQLSANYKLIGLDVESPVWAAGKLAGHWGDNTFGVFTSLVGETKAEVQNPSGDLNTIQASPLTQFTALSFRRNFFRSSNIGLLSTGVTRWNGLDAYVGSLDVALRGQSFYSFTAQAVSTVAQVESDDARHAGWAAFGGGGRTNGEPWRWYIEGFAFSPKVDWNDAGYLWRPDYWGGSGWVAWLKSLQHQFIQRIEIYLGTSHYWNFAELPLSHLFWLSGWCRMSSLWELYLETGVHAPRGDDREMRGGPALMRPWRSYTNAQLSSDSSKIFSGALYSSTAFDAESYQILSWIKGTLASRPFTLDTKLSYTVARGRDRWAETRSNNGDEQYVLAALDQDQLEATTTITFLFTPGLTLQAMAQWLYNVERRDDWRSINANREMLSVNPGQTEQNVLSLNTQLVLRWEYRTGSIFYAVYRHGTFSNETGGGAFQPASALSETFRAPSEDVILLKLAYWWGR